jgi:hypothetical protein
MNVFRADNPVCRSCVRTYHSAYSVQCWVDRERAMKKKTGLKVLQNIKE